MMEKERRQGPEQIENAKQSLQMGLAKIPRKFGAEEQTTHPLSDSLTSAKGHCQGDTNAACPRGSRRFHNVPRGRHKHLSSMQFFDVRQAAL